MTRSFLFIAAAFVVIAACQKNVPEEPSTYEFEISASSDAFGESKTSYANDKTFAWTKGDKISVLFHKNDDNKFFTLTAKTISGATATFAGAVTTGYTFGASDTGIGWALYPAGEHAYNGDDTSVTSDKLITFNLPAVNDLTGTTSSNIPMAAKVPAESEDKSFTFYPAAGIFKFTFNGINTATKAKLTIEEQYTHRMSGNFPMKEGGYVLYWGAEWQDLGTAGSRVSYIVDVKSKTATFYIPFAPWDKKFKPIITLTDADTDDVLYNRTANNYLADAYEPLLTRMVVFPTITCGAVTPWSLESAFGVDWSSASVVSAAGGTGINKISAIADATELYMLLEVQKSALVMDPSHTQDCSSNIFVNGFSRYFGYLVQNGAAGLNDNSGYVTGKAVTEHQGVLYYEWKINRAKAAEKKELVPLGSAGTVELRFLIYPNNSNAGSDWDTYIYAPGDGNLSITLP